MKIKNRDLKLLYKAHLIDKAPVSRKNCPSKKDIIDLLRADLPSKIRMKLIDHVSGCFLCYEEFQSILEIQREEVKLINSIESLAVKSDETSKVYKKNASIQSPQKRKSFLFFPRLSRKYAYLFLGAILIFSTILIPIIFLNQGKREYRSDYYPSLQLIEPVGKKLKKTVLKFRWVEIKESEYYVIEIFDETLLSIWKSNKIYENHFSPPEKLMYDLRKSKTYFWMLTAYFPDGRKIESRLEPFILTN